MNSNLKYSRTKLESLNFFSRCCIDVPIGSYLISLLDILMVKVKLPILFTIILKTTKSSALCGLIAIVCVLNFQIKNEMHFGYLFLHAFPNISRGTNLDKIWSPKPCLKYLSLRL
jgi:hypothetical protein